jgi:hypothetical protein
MSFVVLYNYISIDNKNTHVYYDIASGNVWFIEEDEYERLVSHNAILLLYEKNFTQMQIDRNAIKQKAAQQYEERLAKDPNNYVGLKELYED